MNMWTDEKTEQVIAEAAERGAGIYYEKTKHDLQVVMEAFNDIQKKVDKIPIIEDKIDILTKDMQVVKGVLKDMNKDLQTDEKRIGKLECAVFHA
jgi:uncharacterized protein YpuA (DUF1002 family)